MSDLRIKVTVSCSGSKECPVCMEETPEDRICLTNTCRHWFCYDCIIRWSRDHNYCPLCLQLYSVIISMNNSENQMSFDLIIVENSETTYRRRLNKRRDTLRQRLEDQVRRRDDQIRQLEVELNGAKRIHEMVSVNLNRINSSDNQNNVNFEQTLNEVTDQTGSLIYEPLSVDNQTYSIDTLRSTVDSVTTTVDPSDHFVDDLNFVIDFEDEFQQDSLENDISN